MWLIPIITFSIITTIMINVIITTIIRNCTVMSTLFFLKICNICFVSIYRIFLKWSLLSSSSSSQSSSSSSKAALQRHKYFSWKFAYLFLLKFFIFVFICLHHHHHRHIEIYVVQYAASSVTEPTTHHHNNQVLHNEHNFNDSNELGVIYLDRPQFFF